MNEKQTPNKGIDLTLSIYYCNHYHYTLHLLSIRMNSLRPEAVLACGERPPGLVGRGGERREQSPIHPDFD